MKLSFKSKKAKTIAILGLAIATILPGIMSMKSSGASADEANQIPKYELEPIRTISRDNGGGEFGTHTFPSYIEDGVQYYRNGDIIEVKIELPKDHGSVYAADVIKFDSSKVELLSSYNHIKDTLAENFTNGGKWGSNVSAYASDSSQVYVTAYSNDYTLGGEWKGGVIARMYFKVLQGAETEAGTPITFEFPSFSSGAVAVAGERPVPTHKGYDVTNHAATSSYESAPVVIQAKTPKIVATNPVLNLKTDKINLFEGDLFNPVDQIVSASCDKDATITKDSVVITEGTGKFTKHQPTAGVYRFKYTLTSGITGLSTEKTIDLTVTSRTYSVSSVNVDNRKIEVAVGTTSADFEKMINATKNNDFDVTITSNDGSKFIVKASILNGSTESYKVDANDKLVEQDFNVNYRIAMPLVSYSTEGVRVITPYNGTRAFTTNIDPTQMDVSVAVSVRNTTEGSGGRPSIAPGANSTSTLKSAASTSPNGSTNTKDTTNTSGLFLLAGVSLILFIGMKVKKELSK